MSYSPEFSYSDYEDEEEEEDDKIEIPTIKLKLKLNPYSDQVNKKKKRKKKHKKQREQTHPPVGGKRPFALLQQRNEDQVDSDFELKKPKVNQQQPKSNKGKKGLLLNGGEKPKKRGRPTNKAKAAALAAAMPKVQDTPKKDAKCLFIKLLDSIQKKDEYGFFLEPVNPEYVPDYLKIIKSPMDFSTMRTKIEKREYRGINDFKYDFELIVNNAKLYNAKDTIYYKSADKVHESGLKLIDRYEKQIEEEIQNTHNKQVESREASVDIRAAPTPYKKKKKKVAETGVLYGPDGSLFTVGGVHDIESLIPMDPPFCDPPQMTVTNAAALPSAYYANREEHHYYKHFTHSAHFADYGPFTTLGGQPPGAFYSTVDAAFIYPMLGDDRGEAYIKSLWDFIDGDKDGELFDYVEKKSIHLTRGAWTVMEQTLKKLAFE